MVAKVIQYLPYMYKAVIAGVGAASAALGLAQVGGTTWQEWVYVIATGIGAGALAWRVPNAGTQLPAPTSEGPHSI